MAAVEWQLHVAYGHAHFQAGPIIFGMHIVISDMSISDISSSVDMNNAWSELGVWPLMAGAQTPGNNKYRAASAVSGLNQRGPGSDIGGGW